MADSCIKATVKPKDPVFGLRKTELYWNFLVGRFQSFYQWVVAH